MKAHEVEVPDAAAALNTLQDVAFTYACEIRASSTPERSAEEWARATFEGAPRLLRWVIVDGWIFGLGLRLGPRRSPSHVLGWTIVSNTPSAIALGVESWMLAANLVVRVDNETVVHATFVRYNNWLGRMVWAAASPIHRLVIPYLLNRAAHGAA